MEIDVAAIPAFLKGIERTTRRDWIADCPVSFTSLPLEAKLSVALAFNAISFCYWPTPSWDTQWYAAPVRRGSWALLSAFRSAIDSGKDILNPRYWVRMTAEDLSALLDGPCRLHAVARRAEILNEIGSSVLRISGGSVVEMVAQAEWDAPKLVELLVTHFPSFYDVASTSSAGEVPFFKRAQLFAADAHKILRADRRDGLHGYEALTGCADYMLPALLHTSKILRYSAELEHAVAQRTLIPRNSQIEIEIRAATILAVDLLSTAMSVPSMVVNDIIWIMAGDAFAQSADHHRTITEAY